VLTSFFYSYPVENLKRADNLEANMTGAKPCRKTSKRSRTGNQ